MSSTTMIIIGFIQALAVLLLAPLFSGFSRVFRAKMHSRQGPSIFQNYRDLAKLMTRQEVIPSPSSWVFRATPYITMVAMLLAATIVPIFATLSPIGVAGDLILVMYLFVMIRFFFSLSGVDTGNTFGAIGARRELLVAVLNEPIMLLGLVVMALLAGSTNLGIISTKVISGSIPISTAVWLGGLAFAFSYFVEMGKLPFDLGEAEQELQEGPSAEFSGHSLAILKWALYMKQVVLTALFMAVFLPFGMMTEVTFLGVVISVVTFLLKMFVFYFLVGIVENTEARLRFLKASAVTWIALGAAVLSFVFYLANV